MLRTFLVSAVVFTATLLPATAAVPLVNLVNDQALFVVSISDTPALLRGLETSPLSTTWNDPQVVKFLAPMREKMHIDGWDDEAKAATGLNVRELLALAEGQALFALPTIDFAKMDGATPPSMLVALEVGKQSDKLEKILADAAAKKSIKEKTETFSGVTVNIRQLPATTDKDETDADDDTAKPAVPRVVVWAVVDGVWLLSTDKERVFSAIDAIKQGGVDSALGKSERYVRTRDRVGPAQALIYINVPAIFPLVRDAVAASKAKTGQAPNPMGIDSETMFNALGLDALGETYIALFVDEKETRVDLGMIYTEERGLLKLVAYESGPVSRPDWVPAKWPSVSSMRFSLPKAYTGLEQLLEEISPMIAGMAQGQIRSFNKKLGFDFKRDFIDSVGVDFVSAYAIPPGVAAGAVPAWQEMDQLLAVSLVNEPAFTKATEALKKLGGPAAEKLFVKRDYLGNALFTFTPPPSAPGLPAARGFSYAIANRTLLLGVGSPATVENALQGMTSGQGLFWKRDDVKAVLADIPSDAVAIQVQDFRVIAASLIETVVQLETANSVNSDEAEKNSIVDIDARPDAEVIAAHWGVAGSYVTRKPDGLFSSFRFAHPQK
ncbi:MAG: hypothetical protein ABW223_12160 [Rariglobus sp.]